MREYAIMQSLAVYICSYLLCAGLAACSCSMAPSYLSLFARDHEQPSVLRKTTEATKSFFRRSLQGIPSSASNNSPAFAYPTLLELDSAARLLDKTSTSRTGSPMLGGNSSYRLGFVRAKTAQELFEIRPSGSGSSTCSPLVMSITDLGTILSDVQRPQVYISGEIHGDERVGPLVSLHVARLLALAAECETGTAVGNASSVSACISLRESYPDISPRQVKWLAFLAMRRDTLISPATNCLGYLNVQRNDAGVDPNRDFSYGRGENTDCFLSATARVVREIFRHELIQSVVTFHGGMVALGYEWGAPNHPFSAPGAHYATRPSSSFTRRDVSPDDAVHLDIAKRMAGNAGSFKRVKAYPFGTINSLVYPVEGGMEDWVYASAWDPSNDRGNGLLDSATQGAGSGATGMCRGISAEKSVLNVTSREPVPSGRAAVFLIETSDAKIPQTDTLGCAAGLIRNNAPLFPFQEERPSADAESRGRACDGHVSRNIRLALTAIDFAQPYVCIGSQPSIKIKKSGSSDTPASVSVNWYVGGSEVVDASWLSWHPSPLHFSANSDNSNSNREGSFPMHRYRRGRKLKGSKSSEKRANEKRSSTPIQRKEDAHSGADSDVAIARRDVAYLRTDSSDWTRILDILSPHHVPEKAQAGASGSNHSSAVLTGGTIWSSDAEAHSSSFTASIEVPRRPMSTSVHAFVPVPPANGPAADGIVLQSVSVYWLVAWARVDSHWASQHSLSSPALAPQTHLANARTKPSWNFVGSNTNNVSETTSASELSGLRSAFHGRAREVRGRLYWPSDPVVVTVTYSHTLKDDSPAAITAASLIANRTVSEGSPMNLRGTNQAGSQSSVLLSRRDIASTSISNVKIVSAVKHCAFWTR